MAVNLALFDFDGTITEGDSFMGFVRFAVSPWRFASGCVVLAPGIAGYWTGNVSATRLRASISRVAFAGAQEAVLTGLGRRYAREHLPKMVRPQARERLEWHRAQGDRIVVVSASLDVYLRNWCAGEGCELICTELEKRSGRYTGRYVQGDCSGREKSRRVRQRYALDRYPKVYAYGDTPEDFELLDCAHERFFRWQPVAKWPLT